MGELNQLQASSPVRSIAHQACSAVNRCYGIRPLLTALVTITQLLQYDCIYATNVEMPTYTKDYILKCLKCKNVLSLPAECINEDVVVYN